MLKLIYERSWIHSAARSPSDFLMISNKKVLIKFALDRKPKNVAKYHLYFYWLIGIWIYVLFLVIHFVFILITFVFQYKILIKLLSLTTIDLSFVYVIQLLNSVWLSLFNITYCDHQTTNKNHHHYFNYRSLILYVCQTYRIESLLFYSYKLFCLPNKKYNDSTNNFLSI